MSLDAISTTDPFDTFTKTLCVGYDNVTLTLHSMVGRLGRIVAPIIDLSGRPVKSFLHFVQGPFRVVTFGESFPEVLFLLLEQLRIAAHCGGPMGGLLNQYKRLVSRFPSDLMKSTVVDESLSSFKPMYCSREYQASTRLIQQYEKSTLTLYFKNLG